MVLILLKGFTMNSDRERYRLTIVSTPSDVPAIIRLRHVLKGLLRCWHFRAELVEDLQPEVSGPLAIVGGGADQGGPEKPNGTPGQQP